MSVSIDGTGSLIGVDQGLNIVGLTTLTGGIILDDSISHIGDTDTKIRFPAADTFTVETAGSERLRITSDGYTRLTTANARLEWTASSGSNPFIRSIGSGQQELEFNTGGSERLRITSDGKVRVPDNGKFVAGTGDDLEIFHNGSNSYIKDVGTGSLILETTAGNIDLKHGSEYLARFKDDAEVELYYDNTKRFETLSSGTKTTGRIFINGTNGGFDYNNTAHTLEFLVANGTTHSELNNTAYVPNTNGGKHLGWSNKRWDNVYCNGVLFGGDSTAANTLDDYEEGTSTVSIQNITADTNTVVMKYTKIGSVVCLVGVITIVNKTVSSSANGWFHLPFAPSAHSTSVPGCSIQKNSINTNVAYLGFYGQNTNCYFLSRSGGYQNGNSLGNGQIGFTATYTTH